MKESDASNFLAAALPGGIEAQERRGQSWMETAGVLPIKSPWDELRTLGFACEQEEYEGIFYRTTFPAGWSVVPTDHAMWSDLRDGKGQKRGAIFYKAAFYDRSAHMHLNRRYEASSDYADDGTSCAIRVLDNATSSVLFETARADCPGKGAGRETWIQYSDSQDAARAAAKAWLAEHFPDHEDPLAYWEDAR